MIRDSFVIAAKEVRSSFVSPVAYAVIAGFMLLTGYFFFGMLQYYNTNVHQSTINAEYAPNLNEWVIVPFYQTVQMLLVFFIPIIAMRSFAEERSRGTFELLVTSPVSSAAIVLGKFLGLAVVMFTMLALTAAYPVVLVYFTDPEVLPVGVGFLGLFLCALSFLAIGMVCSALTKSQTVAGVVSMVILLFFYILDSPVGKVNETLGSILTYLSPTSHLQFLLRGVVASGDLVYFFSVILLALFFANQIVEGERWRQ